MRSIDSSPHQFQPGRRTQCFRGVVALDTSASTIEAIPEFLTELNALMKAFIKYEVTVIECDAKLQCVEKFRTGEPIDFEKFAVKGGGGTDFRPVFQYIREEGLYPNVLLFFTDGAGTCCETPPHYPVIWLLTDDGEAPVPWGAQIKFN